MSQVSLHDKLRRLRRPPDLDPDAFATPSAHPASDTPALDRLEETILGGRSEEPSLKARLERLVAVAARGRKPEPWREPVSRPLEEVVQGMRVENSRGEFFLIEEDVPLESHHGDVPLSRFRALLPDTVGVLTAEPELGSFDFGSAVFLDTETTGLAGGAGTAAFLIGIGYVEDDRFRVRQYFMRDYHEEAALLQALAEDLSRFRHLVTFNGKMFDVPLLEARYRLNRQRFPLAQAPHLDLLHPARRLWKARLESCRLQSLEGALLGVRRYGDIPGELIPQIYFDYIRQRDPRSLFRVFHHNRLDLVSLAALTILACQWVEEGRAEDPRDVFSLARVFERARLYERSEAEYRRTLESDPGELRIPALMRLAWRAKRAGSFDVAVSLWESAAEEGEVMALRELAVHHEHRTRDLAAALVAVERGLALLARRDDPRSRRIAAGFGRRRDRIRGKLA
jgi:uncharacterized protein YprB with RNaseH-like and TPR domain